MTCTHVKYGRTQVCYTEVMMSLQATPSNCRSYSDFEIITLYSSDSKMASLHPSDCQANDAEGAPPTRTIQISRQQKSLFWTCLPERPRVSSQVGCMMFEIHFRKESFIHVQRASMQALARGVSRSLSSKTLSSKEFQAQDSRHNWP